MEQMDQDENDCIIMESYINREKLRCPEMFQIDFSSTSNIEIKSEEDNEEIQRLEYLMAKNKSLRNLLDQMSSSITAYMELLKDELDRVTQQSNQLIYFSQRNSKNENTRNNYFYMFGIPYFKDRQYYACPLNDTYFEKARNNELNVIDIRPVRPWRPTDSVLLKAAIRNYELEELQNRHQSKYNALKTQLKNVLLTVTDRTQIQQQMELLENFDYKQVNVEELIGEGNKPYDWMRISIHLNMIHTPNECAANWNLLLKPSINNGKWLKMETQMLKELSAKYNYQDWDSIAKELNTGRSGYQCIIQYRTKCNDKKKNGRWTREEDELLIDLVNRFRIGGYINWSRVTLHMKGRTKNQVFTRWRYSLNPEIKKGRFTIEEDMILVAAVQKFGPKFSSIARFLKGRTTVQIRDRYNSGILVKNLNHQWDLEEDRKLLLLVEKYGSGNWSLISKEFQNRTRIQLRHRYCTIKNWSEKNLSQNIEHTPKRRLKVSDSSDEQMWEIAQYLMNTIEGHDPNELNLDTLYAFREILSSYKLSLRKLKNKQRKKQEKLDLQYYDYFRSYDPWDTNILESHNENDMLTFTSYTFLYLKIFAAKLIIPQEESRISTENQLALENLETGTHVEWFTPPCIMNLLGYRKILLDRLDYYQSKFKHKQKKNEEEKELPITEQGRQDLMLFVQRFYSLFACVSIMAKCPPSKFNSFNEDIVEENLEQLNVNDNNIQESQQKEPKSNKRFLNTLAALDKKIDDQCISFDPKTNELANTTQKRRGRKPRIRVESAVAVGIETQKTRKSTRVASVAPKPTSKDPGRPKRKYVKSGKYTKQAMEERRKRNSTYS